MKIPVGEFLSALRRAKGYTQQEVADKLGISNRTLSAWERGTAMPDVLLLPALADIYGVTVDEILRGERSGAPAAAVSEKSRGKIYKNRYARFSMWAYVLTGMFCLGLLLYSIGSYVNAATIVWVGWRWWLLLLYAGLIVFILSAVLFFAVWRGYENAADEEDEGGAQYILNLRSLVSKCAYAVPLLSAILCFFAVVAGDVIFITVIVVVMLVSAVFAFFVLRDAVKRWGDGQAMLRRKAGLRFFGKSCLWLLIPVAVTVLLSCITYLHYAVAVIASVMLVVTIVAFYFLFVYWQFRTKE